MYFKTAKLILKVGEKFRFFAWEKCHLLGPQGQPKGAIFFWSSCQTLGQKRPKFEPITVCGLAVMPD